MISPIIVPISIDKTIAGILSTLESITIPIHIEHKPKINVKLTRNRSGNFPPIIAPINAPVIIAAALI